MRKSLLLGTTAIMAVTGLGIATAQETDDRIIVTATKREQTLQEVPVAVSVVDDAAVSETQINDLIDLQTLVPSLRVSQLERANNTTFIIRGLGNGGNNPGIEPSVAVYIDGVFRSRSASALSDFMDLERVEVLRGPQSSLFGKNATAGVVNIVTKEPSFTQSGIIEATLGNYNQQILRGYATGPISEKIAYSISGSYNIRDGYTENLAGGDDINDRQRSAVRGQLLFQPTDKLELKVIGDWDQIDEVCCTVFNAGEGPIDPTASPATSSNVIVDTFGFQKQAPGAFDYEVFFDETSTNEIINNGLSLQADYDLGNDITLTSITSWRQKEEDINFEGDFTTLDILGTNTRKFDTETFTQELRLAGETDRLSWLVGGFFFTEDAQHDIDVRYGAGTRAYADALSGGGVTSVETALIGAGALLPDGNPVAPGVFYANGNGIQAVAKQDNEQYNIFAQGDFNITDRLVLTLGVSYYNDEKEVSLASTRNNFFSDLNFAEIGFGNFFTAATTLPPTPANIATVAGGNPALIAALQTASLTTVDDALEIPGVMLVDLGGIDVPVDTGTGLPAGNPFLDFYFNGLQPLGDPTDFTGGKTSDSDTPYTIRLAYDLTDRTNVYASFATGFKASSWNLTQDSRPFPDEIAGLGSAVPNNTAAALGLYAGTRFAGPEETESFEIGAKTVWDWGSLNVAIFDQSIKDFQEQTFQGAGFVLTNAGEQTVRGFEFDAAIQPLEGLTVTWAGTFLDAEYDSFEGAQVVVGSAVDLEDNIPDGSGDLTGATPAGIPEFASSLGVRYERDYEFGTAFIRSDWQYEDEVQVINNVPAEFASREVNLVNASLGVNMESGLEGLLWVRNLFEDEYFTSAFPTTLQPGSFSAYPNPPRTYGVTVRKRF